jgi:hypothetical protein
MTAEHQVAYDAPLFFIRLYATADIPAMMMMSVYQGYVWV